MEEENCHFVYKHLWSPMKAPCSPGRAGPERGEQSVLQRRDFQTSGPERWTNATAAVSNRQWSHVPAREIHLLPTGEISSRSCTCCLWSENALQSEQSTSESLHKALSCYCISLAAGVKKSEIYFECVGVLSSVPRRNERLPPSERGFFIWAAEDTDVQNNRITRLSDILQNLGSSLFTEVKGLQLFASHSLWVLLLRCFLVFT